MTGRTPYRLTRPAEAMLSRLLAEQEGEQPTFPASDQRRYRDLTVSLELGSGPRVFSAAREHLETWDVHRAAGFRVIASDRRAVLGSTVLLGFRFAALHVLGACRVVEVTNDGVQAGFTYATLPLHPERGQQTFLLTRDTGDVVSFRVESSSLPNDVVTRSAAPVALVAQKRAARRYLSAMERLLARDARRDVRPPTL